MSKRIYSQLILGTTFGLLPGLAMAHHGALGSHFEGLALLAGVAVAALGGAARPLLANLRRPHDG